MTERSSRTDISKDIESLDNMINILEWFEIYRTLQPTTAEHIIHAYIQIYKEHQSKLGICWSINQVSSKFRDFNQCMFSDHSRIKLGNNQNITKNVSIFGN